MTSSICFLCRSRKNNCLQSGVHSRVETRARFLSTPSIIHAKERSTKRLLHNYTVPGRIRPVVSSMKHVMIADGVCVRTLCDFILEVNNNPGAMRWMAWRLNIRTADIKFDLMTFAHDFDWWSRYFIYRKKASSVMFWLQILWLQVHVRAKSAMARCKRSDTSFGLPVCEVRWAYSRKAIRCTYSLRVE